MRVNNACPFLQRPSGKNTRFYRQCYCGQLLCQCRNSGQIVFNQASGLTILPAKKNPRQAGVLNVYLNRFEPAFGLFG